MTLPIRYDMGMIADHVAGQNNLVNHMTDLRQQALNVLNHIAHIWTEHGSNAYQEAHYNVDMAFAKVFETIGFHANAINGAANDAGVCDGGVAAGFKGI
jgi:uncharacterized protein YukE